MSKRLRTDLDQVEVNNIIRNDKTFQIRVSKSFNAKLDFLSNHYNFNDKSKLLKAIVEELYDKLHS